MCIHNYLISFQVLPDYYEVTVAQKTLTCCLSNPFFGEDMVTALQTLIVIVLENL